MVNGTAMVLAIANNIFSLRRSMREGAGDFWRFGRGVELVGNRPAGAQGSCRQLSCLKGNSDYG